MVEKVIVNQEEKVKVFFKLIDVILNKGNYDYDVQQLQKMCEIVLGGGEECILIHSHNFEYSYFPKVLNIILVYKNIPHNFQFNRIGENKPEEIEQ